MNTNTRSTSYSGDFRNCFFQLSSASAFYCSIVVVVQFQMHNLKMETLNTIDWVAFYFVLFPLDYCTRYGNCTEKTFAVFFFLREFWLHDKTRDDNVVFAEISEILCRRRR